ncbi:MAG: DUF4012 domain-containing protein [Candidatus Promineifilaceae bacterium]
MTVTDLSNSEATPRVSSLTKSRWPYGCLFLVLFIALGVGYWGFRAVVQPLRTTAGALQQLTALANNPASDPAALVQDASAHVAQARNGIIEADPFVQSALPLLTRLEWLHPSLGDSAPLWHMLDHGTQLAEQLLQSGTTIVEGGAINDRTRLPALLAEIRPRLNTAIEQLAETQTARDQLSDLTWLPETVRPQAEQALMLWDNNAPRLAAGLPLALAGEPHVSTLFGYEQPARYLVLLQVTDELRPSGGLITKFAVIEVKEGVLHDVLLLNISDVEGRAAWDWVDEGEWVQPPSPIVQYMGLGNWVLHDANWWLDFRDSADELQLFWEDMGQQPVDGVIAVNDRSLEQWVDALGGLQLADGSVITAKTLKTFTISQFYEGERGDWDAQQTVVAQGLADAFAKRIAALSQTDIARLLPLINEQIATRDLQMVTFNESAKFLNTLQIDGALRDEAAIDYLYIAESNISYTKSSPFIRQTALYDVWLDANQQPLRSQLSLTTHNLYHAARRFAGFPDFYYDGGRWEPETRSFRFNEGYYGGFTRIARAADVELTSAEPYLDFAETRAALPVLGWYTALERNESELLTMQWKHETTGDCYQLLVQKQPGAPPMEVTVQLHMTEQPVTFSPPPTNSTPTTHSWSFPLTSDWYLNCTP